MRAMRKPPRKRPITIWLAVTEVERTIGPNPLLSSRTMALATNAVMTNR